MSRHFGGQSVDLGDEHESLLRARTFTGPDGAWWCAVVPTALPTTGITEPAEARRASVAGIALYELLRVASHPFRYALAGVEVDLFRTYDELIADAPSGLSFEGLILVDAVWHAAGDPPGFVPFKPGYRWRPWQVLRDG